MLCSFIQLILVLSDDQKELLRCSMTDLAEVCAGTEHSLVHQQSSATATVIWKKAIRTVLKIPFVAAC